MVIVVAVVFSVAVVLASGLAVLAMACYKNLHQSKNEKLPPSPESLDNVPISVSCINDVSLDPHLNSGSKVV